MKNPLKSPLLPALLVAASIGCATSRAKLGDTSEKTEIKNGSTNTETRTITTDLKGTAWFSSAQTITKLKALQTDKTQSIGTDAVNQHGDTNSIDRLIKALELLKALSP